MSEDSGCPGREAKPPAPGLVARFERFVLPPKIEVENNHSSLDVVKDFLESSKQAHGCLAKIMH